MTEPRLTGLHHHSFDNIPDVDPSGVTDGYVLTASGGVALWLPSSADLPVGGSTGQALVKDSGADGDASWHDIEDIATAETDDTLVLAPNGTGGVEFRAETSGTPSDTVTDETTWGIAPDAGASIEYSRGDHTHGSPEEPTGGSGGTGRFYIPFGSDPNGSLPFSPT